MATATILLPVNIANLNAASPPGLEWENSRPQLLFDDTTPEICYWTFRWPADYLSGPILKVQYKMDTATSGTVEFEASVMAVSDGDSANVDTDSYDTANSGSATVPGSTGYLDEISITLTNADSVAAGDFVSIRLARDADDGTNDTATGDCEVIAASLEYTA